MDYARMELLVRELCDLKNRGMDVILVSSGAIAAGRNAVHLKPHRSGCAAMTMAEKQACAAIGQARLMMTYQKQQEETFVKEGGIKERMTAARLGYRTNQREEIERMKRELDAANRRIAELEAKLARLTS